MPHHCVRPCAFTARLRAALVTRCCTRCGLLFQSPRFEPDFYRAYYAQTYRLLLSGGEQPSDDYVADQFARGTSLLSNLRSRLPQAGRLLDIGCGAGGMMLAFREHGWDVLGVEPDIVAASYGVEQLQLPVVTTSAESMLVDQEAFDLIIITGSLEHVHDPYSVLQHCFAAAAPDSLLLLEAHGLGQAAHAGAVGHNHRRMYVGNTLQLLMLQHGWAPEWITDQPLSGPTRPGSVFALGRRLAQPVPGAVDEAIARGVCDTPAAMAALFDHLGIA